MAAPTFVSIGTIATDVSGGASTTPTPPAHLANDIIVAMAINAAGAAMTTATSGWAGMGTILGTPDINLFWKRATGSGTAGPTITAGSTDQFAVCFIIRGCKTTGDPFECLNQSTITIGATVSTVSTLGSTTGVDRLVMSMIGVNNSTTWTTAPPPATWTGNADITSATGTSCRFSVISKVQATAGSVASVTAGTLSSSQSWGTVTVAWIPDVAVATFTQSAFRFYADGTESGSTALATQNTNYTADLLSGSVNIGLRVRLQETAAADGVATDDYQLYYSKNSIVYTDNIIDTYPFSEVTSSASGNFSETVFGFGQSFIGDGRNVSTLTTMLVATGTPTGTCTARIYSHSGTYGTSSVGNILLAESDPIAVSTVTGSLSQITFTFSGVNRINVANATNYVWIIYYTEGTASNTISIGYDATASTHDGNPVRLSNALAWTSLSTDIPFQLNALPIISTYDSASLTEGEATTNRLGAGTGSFVAGKVSEDLEVNDLSITASNHTELVYYFTVNSDAVAHGDNIDFFVYRNADVLDSYSSIPRITVQKAITSKRLGLLGVG